MVRALGMSRLRALRRPIIDEAVLPRWWPMSAAGDPQSPWVEMQPRLTGIAGYFGRTSVCRGSLLIFAAIVQLDAVPVSN